MDTNETPENDTPFDTARASIDEAARQARETLKNPPSLSDKQKALILTVGVTYLLFKIEKRMVKKVVKKAFETYPVRIDLAAYMADLDAYDKARWAATAR